MKLPLCKLIHFSGDPRNWPEFEETCRSMLTDQVPEVLKLQHLKEALSGESRELLSYVLPSEGCYEKAMLLLKKRFENARVICF